HDDVAAIAARAPLAADRHVQIVRPVRRAADTAATAHRLRQHADRVVADRDDVAVLQDGDEVAVAGRAAPTADAQREPGEAAVAGAVACAADAAAAAHALREDAIGHVAEGGDVAGVGDGGGATLARAARSAAGAVADRDVARARRVAAAA